MGNRLASRSPSPCETIETPDYAYINDLPEELLIQIFTYYVSTEGHSELLTNVAPVCRKWQKAAYAPSLWATICDHSLNWRQLLVLSEKGILVGVKKLYLGSLKRMCNVMKKVIGHCPNLEALDLSGLEISRDLFLLLGESCPKLESLTLTYNKVKGYLYWDSGIVDILEPVFCSFGRNLKVLSLNYSAPRPDNILLRIAETCHFLEDFQFTDVPVDDTSDCTFQFPVAAFHQGCPQIQHLSLWGCLLVANGCDKTGGFPNLRSFTANNCELQNPNLHVILKNTSQLKELSLLMVFPVTSEDLLRIPSDRLEKLQLEYACIELTNIIAKWKKTLIHLDIHHFALDISGGIHALVQDNPNPLMKTLCISHSCLSYSALITIAREYHNLRELCVDCCYSIEDTQYDLYDIEELHAFIDNH